MSTLAVDGAQRRRRNLPHGHRPPVLRPRRCSPPRCRCSSPPTCRWPATSPWSPSGSSSTRIEITADRAAAAALAEGNRNTAMGWMARDHARAVSGSSPSRVLLVGLLCGRRRRSRRRGARRDPLHGLTSARPAGSPDRARTREGELMAARVGELVTRPVRPRQGAGLPCGVAPAVDRAGADLRQRRKERRVQAPGRIQARRLDPDPDRPGSTSRSTRAVLYLLLASAADDLDDDLHREADADEAESRPDGGRGRLRPDEEQHHRRQPRPEAYAPPLVPLPRHPVLLHRVLEHDRLPAAADQQSRDRSTSSGSSSLRSRSTPRPRTSRSRWS